VKAAIVVPTIREPNIVRFLEEWQDEFAGHSVIVVEDNPERTFQISGKNVTHYSWAEIEDSLKDKAWIIPRRTDCVRSFGYYVASKGNFDMLVTLDDDCYPAHPDFLKEHWERLQGHAQSNAWVPTGRGWVPRGVPYSTTSRYDETVLNHGMWTNVPDLDAVTQLMSMRETRTFETIDQAIPRGAYFPMCGMNVAVKPQVIPAFYFLLMGRNWPFDRFGDIWCGVILKRICDHLRLGVQSGRPLVEHQRASNVWANLAKESSGYEVNEDFWRAVDRVELTGRTIRDCYAEMAKELPMEGEYWAKLKEAMGIWAGLFPS
jgi:hypothetical protein